jgi:uncharacterized membrane protein SirB2
MSLLAFFQWCYDTPIGDTIRNSTWLFPVIEAFHLLGFGLTAGSVLIVEIRLLGAGLNRQPVAELAANAQPWLLGGVTLMFASGIPLFMSESIKAYYSFAFWVKMTCLFLVLLYTFTLRRRVTRTELSSTRPALARSLAILSIALWFGVAWGGRWIGFS